MDQAESPTAQSWAGARRFLLPPTPSQPAGPPRIASSRPAHLASAPRVDRPRSRAQPEVHAKIALPQITRPGPHLANEASASDRCRHPGANRVPVALPPAQPDKQGMSRTTAPLVAQQIRRLSVVADQQIKVAVVVDIPGDDGPTDLLHEQSRAGVPADLDEAGLPPRSAAAGCAARIARWT